MSGWQAGQCFKEHPHTQGVCCKGQPLQTPKAVCLCRLCVTHLQAAAEQLAGTALPPQLAVSDSAGSMEVDSPKGNGGQQQLSAQRAARGMQLLLEMIRSCQVPHPGPPPPPLSPPTPTKLLLLRRSLPCFQTFAVQLHMLSITLTDLVELCIILMKKGLRHTALHQQLKPYISSKAF